MSTSTPQTREIISFGPYRLVAGERLLTRSGVPIPLGARSLDILIALASQPNEAISKKDLLARAWPDVTVEESSLRFHIAGLRKTLGDGKDGARYITTLAGRGYCFVAPVSRSSDRASMTAAASAGFLHANLPGRMVRMVGRDDDVLKVSAHLTATRFVTVVGAGGVGKTTVAVAVAHHLIDGFAGAVLFVDLGMLSDPNLVATAVASMLGLSVQSEDAAPSLIAFLRERRILLILDTCEHLIETAAALATQIFAAAPQVHILATSREVLQVEGEHVYKLDSLACPPDEPGLTAAVAKTFPAPQLFIERAVASDSHLDLSDEDVAIVVGICRKLDGMALAIELAARRVQAYGLKQTAALLDERLTLLWLGPRMAPPRQKTLQATLDWSYGLLTDLERVVLRRLAIFVGHFTVDAAVAVVTGVDVDQTLAFVAIDSLVAKSMVATRPIGAMMRYRLLDTTRAYALGLSIDDTERGGLAVRHATYYQRWLEQFGSDWPTLSTGIERSPHFAAINNVRDALERCFGPNGNVQTGIGLAAAAAPVFLAMSLLPECHRWSERALLALSDLARGGPDEMHLQAALGVSLMFMRGGHAGAREALGRSLAIAKEHGDALDQLRLLGPLNMFHLRIGDFNAALDFARRCSALAATVEDPAAVALAHSILGISLHLHGDLSNAGAELTAAVERRPRAHRTTTIYLGFEGTNLAGAILARNLWLQGHPDQAADRARVTIDEAAAMDHSLTMCIALIWGISVFLWRGDLDNAQKHIDQLVARAEAHSLAPYLLVGRGFKGELAILRGDAQGGVAILQDSLEKLHAAPYELLSTELTMALIQGFRAMGRHAKAVALADDTIDRVTTSGNRIFMPELLRMKGDLLGSIRPPGDGEAEVCFQRALELSRHQTARAWELRAAIDLATLLAGRGEIDGARGLLRPVFEQFAEGLDTADLRAAEGLLATLR